MTTKLNNTELTNKIEKLENKIKELHGIIDEQEEVGNKMYEHIKTLDRSLDTLENLADHYKAQAYNKDLEIEKLKELLKQKDEKLSHYMPTR